MKKTSSLLFLVSVISSTQLLAVQPPVPGLKERVNQLEAEYETQQAQIDALQEQLDGPEICPAGTPTRFVDNGDGTVCDSETGLMWEIKNQTVQGEDVHDILNGYTWTAEGDDFNTPTGTVFTDFLVRLNYFRFAGYSDWRVATNEEAHSLYSGPDPLGQDCISEEIGEVECFHPIFGPDRGTWAGGDEYCNMFYCPVTPREYWQFVYPPGYEYPGLPNRTPVRAVRGLMR